MILDRFPNINFAHNKLVYQNSLNAIRMIAAFNVFFKHYCVHYAHDWMGSILYKIAFSIPNVPIFFAISGFLLYQSWCSNKKKGNTNSYFFITKVLRIFPSLWIAFFFTTIMLLVLGVIDFHTLKTFDFLIWCISQLTIFQFYNPDFLRGYGVGVVNGSLWTLSVVCQYYIISIFIFISLDYFDKRGYGKFFLVSLLIFSAIARILVLWFFPEKNNISMILRMFVLNSLFFFLIGMFIRYFFNYFLLLLNWKVVSFLFLMWIVFINLSEYFSWETGNKIMPFFVWPIILIAFIFAYKFPNLLSFFKKYNLSYGIFIWHMLFLNFAIEYFPNENSYVIFLICLILTVISSYLQFKYVENILYNWFVNKFMKSKQIGK